jgi:Secretion system C-terminal sorting domain
MKKITLGLLILTVFASYSQSITVNSNVNSTTLVNTFFNGTATNITRSTGNGIGAFQNTNPSFPISNGIVISAGNVNSISGTSELSTIGSNTTDSDLQAVSDALGITGTIQDASFLSFNFVASTSSLSMDYVFASEEYGAFQCSFSDSVAFLLTNLTTGVTTNLAVVPQTTTPVSSATIRSDLYNTNCSSLNSQYFGMFNNSDNAALSGTCFNGRTVILNASSNLVIGNSYKLKIVIGDYQDSNFDSAIFIKSALLDTNILGPDLTLAENTAPCEGNSFLISTGLNISDYTFLWKKNGVTIPGQTSSSLIINQTGNYEVIYTNIATFLTSSDSKIVEFNVVPVLLITNPLPVCSGSPPVDLTNPAIIASSTPGVLTYWLDSLCTLPIPNPASITQSGTYYVKNTNNCGFNIEPVSVTIIQTPIVGIFPNVIANCYYILPSLLIGSYYTGPNGAGVQIMPNTIILASTTLYVYAQNNGCSSFSTLNITINQALATPVISTLNNNHEIYISGTNVAQPLLLETQTIPDGCFYEWFVDGVAIPNSNSASYLVNTVSTSDFPRVFTVKVSTCVPLNCQATSQSFEVIQSPVPAPIGNPNQTFTEGQTLANLLVNGSNIKWYDGALNRNLNSTLLPLSTPLVSGTTYFASQTINSYESPTRLPVLATSTALATSQFNELDFLLSPNPVNDVLQLKANEIIKNITVYSVIGQEFLNLKNTSSEVKLDLSKLTSGNYFVKVETEISQKTYKIIKQ